MDDQTSAPVVRDSAGVRIVEYSDVAGGTPLIGLSPDPLYAHGGGPGDYQFSDMTAGVLLSDGSAVVADGGNDEVVAIAPDGSLRTVVARSGEGPGEVDRVRRLLALPGDTLFVEDDNNSRFSFFIGDKLVRSTRAPGLTAAGIYLRAHGIDDSGGLLMATQAYYQSEVGWVPGYMVRVHLEEATVDTVASHDLDPAVQDPWNPFRPQGRVRASAGEFIITRSDIPEVTWRRPDGSVRQIVRWTPEPVYPTDDDLRRWIEARHTDVPPDDFARVADGYQVVLDEPLPLFSRIHGDDAGRVWLAEYFVDWPTGQPAAYTVIARDGSWLGTIRLPWDFRFFAVRGDRILGFVKDEFDVQRVVVHELLITDGVEDGISDR